jgi:hypothetical protein
MYAPQPETYPAGVAMQLAALKELNVVTNDEALAAQVEEFHAHVLAYGERTKRVIETQAAAGDNPDSAGNPFTAIVLGREGKKLVHAAEVLALNLRLKAKVIGGPVFEHDWAEKAEGIFEALVPLLKDPTTAMQMAQNGPQAALEQLMQNPEIAGLVQDVMTSDFGGFVMGTVSEVMMSSQLGGKPMKDAIAETAADKIVDNGLEFGFNLLDKLQAKSLEKAEVKALLAFADTIETSAKALQTFSDAAIRQGGQAVAENMKAKIKLALGDTAELKAKIAGTIKELIDATPLGKMLGGDAGDNGIGSEGIGLPMDTDEPEIVTDEPGPANVPEGPHGGKVENPDLKKDEDQPPV